MNLKIGNDWDDIFSSEFKKDYFQKILVFLNSQKGNKIYPNENDIFNAFKLTSFSETKVIIIGQDPYHRHGQAHGLSFSVPKGFKLPPSLKNIYKEIESEFNCQMSDNGDLSSWAMQGVLLLNDVLTVEEGRPESHKNIGWKDFTNFVIQYINMHKKNIVYLLWGAPAQKKAYFVDQKNNKILTSVHPSPLSAYRGFFGNNHFIECNNYLIKKNQKVIKWEN